MDSETILMILLALLTSMCIFSGAYYLMGKFARKSTFSKAIATIVSMVAALPTLLLALSALVADEPSSLFSYLSDSLWLPTLLMVAFSVAFGFLLPRVANILKYERDPKHLSVATIALLGLPRAGKTVYTTVLFEKLLLKDGIAKNISPYGEETIDRISADYKKLRAHEMLPPTGNDVFYYRAIYSSSNSRLRYKLEIADYAGERLQDELDANEGFFHKTAFFKYVTSCDVVFVAVDLEEYETKRREGTVALDRYISDIETSFISALHMIREQSNILLAKKTNTPIALLFLKADCLRDWLENNDVTPESYIERINDERSMLYERFKKLITYCSNNFTNFNSFVVSALSEVNAMDYRTLIDINAVEEPLLWAMERISR